MITSSSPDVAPHGLTPPEACRATGRGDMVLAGRRLQRHKRLGMRRNGAEEEKRRARLSPRGYGSAPPHVRAVDRTGQCLRKVQFWDKQTSDTAFLRLPNACAVLGIPKLPCLVYLRAREMPCALGAGSKELGRSTLYGSSFISEDICTWRLCRCGNSTGSTCICTGQPHADTGHNMGPWPCWCA